MLPSLVYSEPCWDFNRFFQDNVIHCHGFLNSSMQLSCYEASFIPNLAGILTDFSRTVLSTAMGSWLAACQLHGTVAFQLTRRASFVSSQATRYFAFTRNHTVLSWGKPCSMWHVLRVLTCGLKAHCRHITEFGTCSSSADGQHTFDQSAQEWKRLTERRSKKDGELSSSAVFSFVCRYCANFKLTAVAVRRKKIILALKTGICLHTGHHFCLSGPSKMKAAAVWIDLVCTSCCAPSEWPAPCG